MPGGQDFPLANTWRGINRMLSPVLLPESESPDCQDCAPYGDKQGLLGPRPGRRKVANSDNNIIGVGTCNFPYGRFRILATDDGAWSPVVVPWPSIITVPGVNGCSGCSIYGSGAYGSLSSLGAFFIAISLDSVVQDPAKGIYLRVQPVFVGSTDEGAGWVGPSGAGPATETPRQFVENYGSGQLFADPNGQSIVGYLDGSTPMQVGYWDGASPTTGAAWKALLIALEDGHTVGGVSVPLGSSLALTGTGQTTINVV